MGVSMRATTSEAIGSIDTGSDDAGVGERAAFDPQNLTPQALIALRDELRPHALTTLAALKDARIDVKIISGDSPRTVASLARQAGIGENIRLVTGAELDAMSESEFTDAAISATIFGRATPRHKELLVAALQAQGRYVAMLGDGTNDALSLKRSDVGVAMESGSSVTRNVADVVLLKDSFGALTPAFVEGRRINTALTRSLNLFIARVVTSILVIVFVSMIGLGFPYEPAQVALTVFTVGIPSLLLTRWARPEPPEPDVLRRLARFVLPAGIVTAVMGTLVYAGFYRLIQNGLTSQQVPLRAAERWSTYTGVTIGDADFETVTATIVAQSALSGFVSFAAFGLLLFLEPPSRFFTPRTQPSPSATSARCAPSAGASRRFAPRSSPSSPRSPPDTARSGSSTRLRCPCGSSCCAPSGADGGSTAFSDCNRLTLRAAPPRQNPCARPRLLGRFRG